MLVSHVVSGPGLGVSTEQLTNDEEVQVPQYVSVGQQVVNAENNLKTAYSHISTIVQAVGPDAGIPLDLLRAYNGARSKLLVAAEDWMDARRKTPDEYLPDAGKEPEPPPAFDIPSGVNGVNGVNGAFHGPLGETVPASAISVVFGPEGKQKSLPLGDAAHADLWPAYEPVYGDDGLGNPLVAVVIIVLSVAVVGLTIAVIIREWKRAQVEANRARARESEAIARSTEAVTSTWYKAYINCAGTSTDANVRQKCLQSASTGVKEAIAKIPKAKGPPGGPGFFGIAAIVIVTAAAAVGGYLLYKRKQAQRGLEKTGRFAMERRAGKVEDLGRYRRRRRRHRDEW